MTETDLNSLEGVLARGQIERLLFDYAFHLDMNHPDELAKLFVDDCVVSYAPGFGAEGLDAYKETLKGIGSFFAATSHHVSNVVVDFVSRTRRKCGRLCWLGIAIAVRSRMDGFGASIMTWC